jgi:hypothetical protein
MPPSIKTAPEGEKEPDGGNKLTKIRRQGFSLLLYAVKHPARISANKFAELGAVAKATRALEAVPLQS